MQSGRVPIDIDITGAKGLWLIVTDGGNGYECDWANWIEPTLVRADGSFFPLTRLQWKSATAGYGQVQVGKNCAGGPLRLDKRTFNIGIGTHAPSIIEYQLPENFSRFQAKAGPDMAGVEQACGSGLEFIVFTEPPPANILEVSSERGYGFEAAQESLKNMTVADGLEVSLFAAEPMLSNPTDIDIDEKGRVWVAEAVNYRSSFKPWGVLDPKGDRIVILEDTNNDGVADVAKTFYQDPKMQGPLGVCVLGNQVIVSCSPEVFVLTDSDGDDKADKKEILFTGIGGFDHDHGVHAFVLGPDGKLYFNFGNEGGQLKDKNGKIVVDLAGNQVKADGKPYRNGMIFHCNLDGSEIETLAWNFRNNYETTIDSFGTLWQSDNDDDGNRAVRINYVMEYGNYGFGDEMTGAGWGQKRTNMEDEIPRRHWHQNDPGVVPNLLITGAGAPTGITLYEGRLLPKVFWNQMIHCDAGPRVVRSYPVKPEGAGYSAEIKDILSSSDSWFRPSDVCVATDGSLYVSDWNDAGVGGHNMADRNPRQLKGRIYRIAPPGHKPMVPKTDLKSAIGCVAALQSPNQATRYSALCGLHEMHGKDGISSGSSKELPSGAKKELTKLWKKGEPQIRARALWNLGLHLKGGAKQFTQEAIKDTNPDIRMLGLRMARQARLDVVPYVKKLLKDPSPQVRRECAIALRHHPSPEAPTLWAQLAAQYDGKDRWYLEALGIATDKQEDTFLAAWLQLAGDNWNTPAGRDILWRARSALTAPYLAKLIADKNTSAQDRARYFRAFDFLAASPQKETALVNLLALEN